MSDASFVECPDCGQPEYACACGCCETCGELLDSLTRAEGATECRYCNPGFDEDPCDEPEDL